MNSKFKAEHKLLLIDYFKFPLAIVSFIYASLLVLTPQMTNRNFKVLGINYYIKYIDFISFGFIHMKGLSNKVAAK